MFPLASGVQGAAPAGTHSSTATKGQAAPAHVARVEGAYVDSAGAWAARAGASTPRRSAPTAAKLAPRCWQ